MSVNILGSAWFWSDVYFGNKNMEDYRIQKHVVLLSLVDFVISKKKYK